jgi:cytochrome c biogenesis factor
VSFGATAPSGPVRTRLGFGSIVWALIPLLSLGLLAPVPFAVAAVRLRQRRLWMATAVYALGSALLILGAFGPQGGWGDTLAGTVILLLMVAGTAHAFLIRGRVFAPSPMGTTMKPPRWGLLVVSIGVLLVGVGVMVVGVHDLVDNLRPVSAASRHGDGVVIRIKSVTTYSGSQQRTTYHPVVRFLTEHEQVIVFTSNVGGSYSVGDSVKVRYDPNNPQRARLDSLGDRVWGAVVAVGLFLGALVVMFWGGVMFVRASAGTPLAWRRTIRDSSGRPRRGG